MVAEARSAVHPPVLISVVIPVLNEGARIDACLRAVNRQDPPVEVLVVDGGSADSTTAAALAGGAQLVASGRGRAEQMNAGAALARGDILLFLHADTLLPAGAAGAIRAAVGAGADAGAFALAYDPPRLAYRIAAALANLYCRVSGDCFGDRAIFVTRRAFAAAGGYRHLPLMEDLDLTVRLRRRGARLTLLSGRVTTSARRFEEQGILRGGWAAWRLCHAYHRQKPLDLRAARFYRRDCR